MPGPRADGAMAARRRARPIYQEPHHPSCPTWNQTPSPPSKPPNSRPPSRPVPRGGALCACVPRQDVRGGVRRRAGAGRRAEHAGAGSIAAVALGIRLVLVHGSRPQVNEQLRREGLYPAVRSRPVTPTDAAALECAKEAGEIRHRTSRPRSRACQHAPMSHSRIPGHLGQLRHGPPHRRAGRRGLQAPARSARSTWTLKFAIEKGSSVVLLSPLGFSPTGDAFNLAMEDLGTAWPWRCAPKLIFLSSSRGVLNDEHARHRAGARGRRRAATAGHAGRNQLLPANSPRWRSSSPLAPAALLAGRQRAAGDLHPTAWAP